MDLNFLSSTLESWYAYPGIGHALRLAVHFGFALAAGGAIGIERSNHGRAAGFRTYALVALGAAVAITMGGYPNALLSGDVLIGRADSGWTRVMQGVLTGVGFLGAGVIFREGFSIRGLTTAASIWVTAAIGMMMGAEMYLEGTAATVLTLGVLSVFRHIEAILPRARYVHLNIEMKAGSDFDPKNIRTMLRKVGFRLEGMSFASSNAGEHFEYQLVVSSKFARRHEELARELLSRPDVQSFQLLPARD